MPTEIGPATDVVALSVPLTVDTAEGTGTAVAIANTGPQLAYLVAFRRPDKRPPAWFATSEIQAAHPRLPQQ
jgi:hypothetical protein